MPRSSRVTSPSYTICGPVAGFNSMPDDRKQRSHALLTALPLFKLQPHVLRNRDLRQFTAELRGVDPDSVTVGQMTYDLRRLRVHGLIQRLPRSSRYQVTDTGLATAMYLNAIHDRLLPTGLAHLNSDQPSA